MDGSEERVRYDLRLLRRRFAVDPSAGNPKLECLDKSTGEIRTASVENECVVKGHDKPVQLATANSYSPTKLIKMAESAVAGPLARLVMGQDLKRRERLDLALLLAAQATRTPRGRA